ncbi:hypothetical protein KY345_00460 [Candidatus Woesearchaeota archaeon]|nr:hypothetical protein [Candidatus Woesearchaeota archaeon]
MKYILFTIIIILLIAGCARIETPKQPVDTGVSVNADTSESISETDDITQLEDPEAEQELDEIGGLLEDW